MVPDPPQKENDFGSLILSGITQERKDPFIMIHFKG
jgi:hypothetical protein